MCKRGYDIHAEAKASLTQIEWMTTCVMQCNAIGCAKKKLVKDDT